jgi:hypothetical protein
VVVIYLLSLGLYEYGLLTHATAALTLVLGFTFETTAVIITIRIQQHRGRTSVPASLPGLSELSDETE